MHRIHIHHSAIVLLFAAQFGGCTTVYFPNTATVPSFAEPGECQASAYLGSDGIEARVAYSPTQQFGLAASGSWLGSKPDSTASHYRAHWYIEGAAIYYSAIRTPVLFSLTAGAGYGSASSKTDFFSTQYAEGTYIRPYMQGAMLIGFGSQSNDNPVPLGEFGFLTRFAGVHFTQFTLDHKPQDISTVVFWEPVLLLRIHSGSLFAEIQGGISAPLQRPEFDWQFLLLSMGVGVAIR